MRCAIIAALSSLLALSSGQIIGVLFEGHGADFIVGVDDAEWFRSSSLSIRYGGQVWSSANSDQYMLVLTDKHVEVGEDSIGKFNKRRYSIPPVLSEATLLKRGGAVLQKGPLYGASSLAGKNCLYIFLTQ